MDLNTIAAVVRPRGRDEFEPWQEGDAWLGGGTWLFSEPQPDLRRLIDLAGLGWEALRVSGQGLEIAATCKIAELDALDPPAAWIAAPLIGQCCRALLGSFKIWNMATIGGNICMSLPAGPMTSLAVAMEGVCTIWAPSGDERQVPVAEFVTGPQRNALLPGEVLRRVDLPAEALSRRTAFRQISLTPLGRSGALLIGTRAQGGDAFRLTVTASTRRPVALAFTGMPDAAALRARLESEIPEFLYYDDIHGRPDWRRHLTFEFAEQIRRELAAEGAR